MKFKDKKYFVLFGAVLLQLCIGTIYSWSLFNSPLSQKFNVNTPTISFTFSLAVFAFALVTIFSGRLQDKIGPRKVSLIGGLLYSLGVYLCSFATTPTSLYIYYGVIAGIGIGFIYVCPLTTCMKWFPNNKGTVTGVTIGAFGLGSLLFNPLIQKLMSIMSVEETFRALSLIYLVLLFIGACLLSVPPKEYQNSNKASSISKNNFTTKEMVKDTKFYFIWFIMFCGSATGLLVISQVKDIAISLANLTTEQGVIAVSIVAIFNATGRLGWGALSDKIEKFKVIILIFIVSIVGLAGLISIPLNMFTYYLFVALIASSFGGILTVFPTITSEHYGLKNIGSNYGVVYQAYGVSALIGPILTSSISNLKVSFLISICISLVGLALSILILKKYIIKEN